MEMPHALGLQVSLHMTRILVMQPQLTLNAFESSPPSRWVATARLSTAAGVEKQAQDHKLAEDVLHAPDERDGEHEHQAEARGAQRNSSLGKLGNWEECVSADLRPHWRALAELFSV